MIVEVHKQLNPASICMDMSRKKKLFRNYCRNIFTTRPFRTNFNKKLKSNKTTRENKKLFHLIFAFVVVVLSLPFGTAVFIFVQPQTEKKHTIKKIMLYTFFFLHKVQRRGKKKELLFSFERDMRHNELLLAQRATI